MYMSFHALYFGSYFLSCRSMVHLYVMRMDLLDMDILYTLRLKKQLEPLLRKSMARKVVILLSKLGLGKYFCVSSNIL